MWRALLGEFRPLLTLALPLALAQLLQAGMTFVDTVMVGRLGGAQLAAIALGATVYMFATILLQGVIFAVGPTVSQAYGARRHGDVAAAARQGLWLALFLALPAVLLLSNATPLLLAMGQAPEAAVTAGAYLKAAAWGFAPSLLLVALRSFLEGIGDARPIMWLMAAGLAANVVLDELLIFGRLGLPELGVVGAGYATAFVHTLMFLLAALYVTRYQGRYAILQDLRGPDWRLLGGLLRLGAPIGLTIGFESGLFSATALLMGLVGELQLAAHQVAIQSSTMTFTLAVGVAVATSIRVGQAVGRSDPAAARLAGIAGIGLSVLVMTGSAALFRFAPELIIGIFLDAADPANLQVVEYAVLFLGIAATFQIFDGIQVAAAGTLRGYKDTTIPMVISLLSYWVVGIGSGSLLAFRLGWGGRGLWTGLVLGLATAALLLVTRFHLLSRNRPLRRGSMVQ